MKQVILFEIRIRNMSTDQKAFSFNEKRKHPRIETSNEINYILLDEGLEKLEQGKGRTRDLSQGGILLETQKPLKAPFIILITLNLEGSKVQVKGRITHTRESEKPGYYLTGIRFVGSREEHINAITTFIKNYFRKKYEAQKVEDITAGQTPKE